MRVGIRILSHQHIQKRKRYEAVQKKIWTSIDYLETQLKGPMPVSESLLRVLEKESLIRTQWWSSSQSHRRLWWSVRPLWWGYLCGNSPAQGCNLSVQSNDLTQSSIVSHLELTTNCRNVSRFPITYSQYPALRAYNSASSETEQDGCASCPRVCNSVLNVSLFYRIRLYAAIDSKVSKVKDVTLEVI